MKRFLCREVHEEHKEKIKQIFLKKLRELCDLRGKKLSDRNRFYEKQARFRAL